MDLKKKYSVSNLYREDLDVIFWKSYGKGMNNPETLCFFFKEGFNIFKIPLLELYIRIWQTLDFEQQFSCECLVFVILFVNLFILEPIEVFFCFCLSKTVIFFLRTFVSSLTQARLRLLEDAEAQAEA